MDLKTRLEEDRVLFANYVNKTALTNILTSLNGKGIYTVEDLINYKESDFPKPSRKTYMAFVHIFKHAYLGQDLVLDVLLEKEYTFKEPNYDDRGIQECAKDLYRLGFKCRGGYNTNNFAGAIAFFLSESQYKDKKFSMEYLLKECYGFNATGPDIRKYYLEYIDKKKKNVTELTTENIPDVLEGLKIQLQGLLTMRDGIDKQIEVIQEKIKSFSEGEKSHGRK